ncbi:septation ring formation regulator EzrA [Pelagibacteraceae bacterium]|nr:septation ring formation regulator EzrA [Pelagibacteraceae bacterium]
MNVFLTLYVGINLVGGERGMFSFFEKKNIKQNLVKSHAEIEKKLVSIKNKNNLLSNKVNLDYVDMLYREKLKFGEEHEIIIRLK